MRVTVNYGIDFKEIPDLLQKMINDCEELNKQADSLLSIISYSVSKNDDKLLPLAIHDLRLALTQIDLTVGDLNEMALGYIRAKNQVEEAKKEIQPEPDLEEDTKSEEPDLGVAVDD